MKTATGLQRHPGRVLSESHPSTIGGSTKTTFIAVLAALGLALGFATPANAGTGTNGSLTITATDQVLRSGCYNYQMSYSAAAPHWSLQIDVTKPGAWGDFDFVSGDGFGSGLASAYLCDTLDGPGTYTVSAVLTSYDSNYNQLPNIETSTTFVLSAPYVPPPAPRVPSNVSLSIPARAYVGTAITSSTRVTDQYGVAKANWTVTLQKVQSGTSTWKSIKSVKTTATGAAFYRFANGPSGYYRWVTAAASGAPSKISRSVKVTSTARVAERRPATSMTHGRYLSVSGSVSSVRSPVVYIQYRYTGGAWRTGPRATVRGTAVSGKIKLSVKKTAYTRLYVKAATSYRGSVSRSYATKVR